MEANFYQRKGLAESKITFKFRALSFLTKLNGQQMADIFYYSLLNYIVKKNSNRNVESQVQCVRVSVASCTSYIDKEVVDYYKVLLPHPVLIFSFIQTIKKSAESLQQQRYRNFLIPKKQVLPSAIEIRCTSKCCKLSVLYQKLQNYRVPL